MWVDSLCLSLFVSSCLICGISWFVMEWIIHFKDSRSNWLPCLASVTNVWAFWFHDNTRIACEQALLCSASCMQDNNVKNGWPCSQANTELKMILLLTAVLSVILHPNDVLWEGGLPLVFHLLPSKQQADATETLWHLVKLCETPFNKKMIFNFLLFSPESPFVHDYSANLWWILALFTFLPKASKIANMHLDLFSFYHFEYFCNFNCFSPGGNLPFLSDSYNEDTLKMMSCPLTELINCYSWNWNFKCTNRPIHMPNLANEFKVGSWFSKWAKNPCPHDWKLNSLWVIERNRLFALL